MSAQYRTEGGVEVSDSITINVNGKQVAFELRSQGPHHKLYENGGVQLMITKGRCYANVDGPPVSGATGDSVQEAFDACVAEALEWVPIIRELERIGVKHG